MFSLFQEFFRLMKVTKMLEFDLHDGKDLSC